MYYEKKTLFLEFRKLRNWRRWVVAAGLVVAGGQMVADGQVVACGRVVAGGHSEKIQKGWLPSAKLEPTFTFLGRDFAIFNTFSWQNPYQEK